MAWMNNYIREKTMRGNQSFMSQFKKYIWAFHIFLRLKFFRLSRRLLSTFHQISIMHYSDVIMGGTASQITSLVIFTQPIIQTKIQENIKVPRHWLCAGNSPVTCEFPAQMASNAKNVSIWWRHHDGCRCNGDTRSQGNIGHDINLFPQYIQPSALQDSIHSKLCFARFLWDNFLVSNICCHFCGVEARRNS